jgi:hypothetical protein
MLEDGESPFPLKLVDDVAHTDRPYEHGFAFGAADRLSGRTAWPQDVGCHTNLLSALSIFVKKHLVAFDDNELLALNAYTLSLLVPSRIRCLASMARTHLS